MMKNNRLGDSDELMDQVKGDSELKFSLTHGGTKMDGITPKNI